MKWILIPLILILLLAHSFAGFMIIAEFRISQDQISRKSCINRFKSENNCKGSCQLIREMSEKSDDSKRSQQQTPGSELTFCLIMELIPPDLPFEDEKDFNIEPDLRIYPPPVFALLHPPAG